MTIVGFLSGWEVEFKLKGSTERRNFDPDLKSIRTFLKDKEITSIVFCKKVVGTRQQHRTPFTVDEVMALPDNWSYT